MASPTTKNLPKIGEELFGGSIFLVTILTPVGRMVKKFGNLNVLVGVNLKEEQMILDMLKK